MSYWVSSRSGMPGGKTGGGAVAGCHQEIDAFLSADLPEFLTPALKHEEPVVRSYSLTLGFPMAVDYTHRARGRA